MSNHLLPKSSRVGRRSVTFVLAATLTISCLAAWSPDAPMAHAAPADPLTAASAQAVASGVPTDVPAETTDTSTVTAMPDGTFELSSSLTPVRTQIDGRWQPIDTTLQTNTDGTISPVASAEDVSFSGGGSGPAVTLAQGDGSLSFSWPTSLPAPTLDGNTATYASVLPGVDLQLTAGAGSYSEILVVHDAAAAANPALSNLHLTVDATNLDVSTDPHGGLVASDAAGNEVMHGSQPVMWDSEVDPRTGPAPSADDSGSGTVAPIAVSMPPADATASPDDSASTTITLSAPKADLTGPGVVYPLYIDPPMSPYRGDFAVVTTTGWHYYDDTTNDLKVGYCAWAACNGSWDARTYLAFNTSALGGQPTTAVVSSAEVDLYEIHSAGDCTPENVDLYSSGAIGSSTAWPGPIGSYLDVESSNRGDTCSSSAAGDVSFTSTALTSYLQSTADHDSAKTNFAVRAPDEGNAYQWKRFDSAAGPNSAAAQLTVHYDFPPSTPHNLAVSGAISCPQNTSTTYVQDSNATVKAISDDYNPGAYSVALWFELRKAGSSTVVAHNTSGVVSASGAVASWSTTLSEAAYTLDAYATSVSSDTPDAKSKTSGTYAFTVDTTAPAVPTISSFSYPRGVWGSGSGGTFSFASDSDTAGFTYAFDSNPFIAPTGCNYNIAPTRTGGMVATANGSATITVPSTLTPGYHTISVEAFDDAHNVSNPSSSASPTGTGTYGFYVAPTAGDNMLEAESWAPTSTSGSATTAICHKADGCVSSDADSTGPSPCNSTSAATSCVYVAAGSRWSNGNELALVANRPAKFHFPFTASVEADYALGVQVTSANHFGSLVFRVDGRQLSPNGSTDPVSAYNPSVITNYVSLGGVHLTSGTHDLEVDIVAADPSAVGYNYTALYGNPAYLQSDFTSDPVNDNGYSAGLDYFRITRINSATYTSITAAMNNHGIAVDGTNGASFDMTPTGYALSSKLLTALLQQPVAGVNFTLPNPNANGNDNVIAAGQTIPLPTTAPPTHVDLLVASTCGDTTASTVEAFTINYGSSAQNITDNTDIRVPRIPDWIVGTTPSSSLVTPVSPLAYRDAGSAAAKDTAHQPLLYVVRLPTNGGTVQSLTLPITGSNLSSCSTSSLHILAVTTDTDNN